MCLCLCERAHAIEVLLLHGLGDVTHACSLFLLELRFLFPSTAAVRRVCLQSRMSFRRKRLSCGASAREMHCSETGAVADRQHACVRCSMDSLRFSFALWRDLGGVFFKQSESSCNARVTSRRLVAMHQWPPSHKVPKKDSRSAGREKCS